MEFSKAKMKEVIKEQTDKRVSEESSLELGELLEQYAGDIAEEAIAKAQEKNRKTVRAEEIRDSLNE